MSFKLKTNAQMELCALFNHGYNSSLSPEQDIQDFKGIFKCVLLGEVFKTHNLLKPVGILQTGPQSFEYIDTHNISHTFTVQNDGIFILALDGPDIGTSIFLARSRNSVRNSEIASNFTQDFKPLRAVSKVAVG